MAVEKEYRFDTDDGTRTLAELFNARSQLRSTCAGYSKSLWPSCERPHPGRRPFYGTLAATGLDRPTANQ